MDLDLELAGDARGLFSLKEPLVFTEGGVEMEVWDEEGLSSWKSLSRPVRVIRSRERRAISRQLTGKREIEEAEWMWVTTRARASLSTSAAIRLGHSRWLIENQALGEMVTYWHADHVYRHHPRAIIAFWLTLMLALNPFRAFLHLKPKTRPAFPPHSAPLCLPHLGRTLFRFKGDEKTAIAFQPCHIFFLTLL